MQPTDIGSPTAPPNAPSKIVRENCQHKHYTLSESRVKSTELTLRQAAPDGGPALRFLCGGHKWATLRIHDRGVIAYVTNGGFLSANSADGLRKTLAEEFTSIYVFNLRGNGRLGGEERRKDGRPLFEFGGWNSDGTPRSW